MGFFEKLSRMFEPNPQKDAEVLVRHMKTTNELIRAAASSDPWVRMYAIRYLGAKENVRGFEPIYAALIIDDGNLTDEERKLQIVAKRAFWRLHIRLYHAAFAHLGQMIQQCPAEQRYLVLHAYVEKIVGEIVLKRKLKPGDSEKISGLIRFLIENNYDVEYVHDL